jgi:hypothetical protein
MRIGLAAGARQVEPEAGAGHCRCAEAVVQHGAAVSFSRHTFGNGRNVSFEGEVQVEIVAVQQQIPHRAANQVEGSIVRGAEADAGVESTKGPLRQSRFEASNQLIVRCTSHRPKAKSFDPTSNLQRLNFHRDLLFSLHELTGIALTLALLAAYDPADSGA